MLLAQRASERVEFERGGSQIRRIRPGLRLNNPNDPGFGPLGAFDHAHLQPGVVAMHQHRNDEIFSYMRSRGRRNEDYEIRPPVIPLEPERPYWQQNPNGVRAGYRRHRISECSRDTERVQMIFPRQFRRHA